VIRGGIGLYYNDLNQNGWVDAFRAVNEPLSGFLAPDEQGAGIDPNYHTPYALQFSLGVERVLSQTWRLSIHYEHQQGLHQYRRYEYVSDFTLPATAPSISLFRTDNRSRYDGVALQAQHSFSEHFELSAHYTLGSAKTWGATVGELADHVNEVSDVRNAFGPGDFGPSGEDVRHRFVINAIYELPFKGNRLVEGWQVGLITQAQVTVNRKFQPTYTLKDMDAASLRVLRTRRDIACVLVNPVQAMHPNASAPADSGLIDSGRNARFDRAAYAAWLRQLRAVCAERRIILIFDEVFVGFRLARGGAQEYFGVRADLVTYGKSLGGGLPVGVVCGGRDLMKRYDEEHPADVCLARGTFNSHPYVMGAMHEFLTRLESEPIRALYRDLDATWERRAAELNARLQAAELPVQVANLSSIWTFNYLKASRYNWMFQYYLRAQGLSLSWIGTARLIFSLNYSDADFAAVADRVVAAAEAMRREGWWWQNPALTNKAIRRRVLRELFQAWWTTSSIGSTSSPRSKCSGARQ
jgi:hypothetical protein